MKLSEARILVVDDEPILRQVYSEWLGGGKNSPTATARDGMEALEMLLTARYDLLVTDVNMPRMDGVTLLRRLSQVPGGVPAILFVSGFGNVDEREMYGLGVQAFLLKPTLRAVMVSMAERAIEGRTRLWTERAKDAPKQRLTLQATEVCREMKPGALVMGHGGFSAPLQGVAARGKVEFECQIAGSETRMTGEGILRWRSQEEERVGIEITFLEEGWREEMAARIAEWQPRAFIPPL